MNVIIVGGGWAGCAAAIAAQKQGARVILIERTDMLLGTGLGGSCKLLKESLSTEIQNKLNKTGVAVIPIPPSRIIKGKLALKACQQYALPEFENNIVLTKPG